jgi:hypothetical protein
MPAFDTERPPTVRGGVQTSGPHCLVLGFAANPAALEPYRKYLESGQAWADFGTWFDGRDEGTGTYQQRLADAIHAELCGNADRGCARYQPGKAHHDFYQMRAENLLEALGPLIGTANVLPAVQAVLDEVN